MVAAKSFSRVSALELLFSVATVLVSTNLSDAFVPRSSIASIAPRNELHHDGCTTQETCLFASTLPSKSGSGLDVIDSWKLLPDGRIKGVMAGSGDSVLTSPLRFKNGLKEKSTVRTISGSRYKLGTPASGGSNLSADRLGTTRTTLGVRSTQPLQTNPMGSQEGFMQNFLDNKPRATLPVQSSSAESQDNGNGILAPLVGGASAIAIGAAIGSGVVSDKGIDISKVNVDPSEVLKSVKSLDLPDIKSLKAPVIPSGGISLPKFEGLPSVSTPKFEGLPSISAPKLPDIGTNLPNINLPSAPDFKLPDVSSVTAAGGKTIKSLGNSAGKALGNALDSNGIELPKSPFAEKEPEMTTYGRGPYKVPMPYLDRKIVEAEKERKAQEEAAKALAAEKEEAARIQQIREQTEAEIMARQSMEREQALKERSQFEARLKQDADTRVKKAEEEASRLRAEVEQVRLAAVAKEQAATQETARLSKEAEAAFMKEQAAKEEFTRKIQEAEIAKLQEAQDFAAKLAAAEVAAAKGRALEEDTIAKQRMAAEAASRQAIASAEVRKASIGAAAARKSAYPSPSLSTYQAWQERQRMEYETRMTSAAEGKSNEVAIQNPAYVTGEKLSTFERWQKSIAAKQVVSASADAVKAAYITGAPAPLTSQLVSGTTSLSEAATALNGDLGYVIAGSSALIAGITFAYENQKIQDELAQPEILRQVPIKTVVPPPPPAVAAVPPTPPPVPPISVVEPKQVVTTSVTMAIDAKEIESTSVTKAVSPPPTPPASTASDAKIELVKETQTAPENFDSNTNQGSYLESMSNNSGATKLKSSYSPFSNAKKAITNDSLYSVPSTEVPQVEEAYEEVNTPEDTSALDMATNGQSYLDSMSASDVSPKASYSPFGTPKIRSDDSLYAPPPQVGIIDEQQTTVNGGSYLDSMSGSNDEQETYPKVSYSPFGQPKTVQDDPLYGPPDTPANLEEAEASTPATNGAIADSLPLSSSEITMPTNQGSYLNALNDPSESNYKTSYSPFGKKPQAVEDSGFYSPDNIQEASLSSSPSSEDVLSVKDEGNMKPLSTPYLEGLTDPASSSPGGPKRSFSPFANGWMKPKGQASGSDILYKPLFDGIQSPKSPPLSDMLPSEEERDSTPVANYIERLVIPLSEASADGKRSFSPFGDGGKSSKGQASDSEVLYQPPEKTSLVSEVLPSDEERDSIPVSNYLQRLVIPLNEASDAVKKSFSPFGDGSKNSKRQASGSDNLYKPPAEVSSLPDDVPSDEERDSTPVSNYLERLVIPLNKVASAIKKSFSPFGDAGKKRKWEASGSDLSYNPPAKTSLMSGDLPSDKERDNTPVSNYLKRIVIPLGSADDGPTVTAESPTFDVSDTESILPDSPSTPIDEHDIVQIDSSEIEIPDPIVTYRQDNDASPYLDSISDSEEAPLKSSYSPFQSLAQGRFESSISDLYTTTQLPESADENNDFNNGGQMEPNGSYLESIGDDIPSLKNSFNPFGSFSESKLSDSSTDSLY